MSKLRYIETSSRKAGLIQSIIDDLERTVQILSIDISTEEERVRVFDRSNPSYPVLARTLLARHENLRVTIADLKNRLASLRPVEARKAA